MDLRLLVLLSMICAVAGLGRAAVRPTAVAGAFYPAAPEQVRRDVERMLEAAPAAPAAVAVVVPHAGWVYSGATAARSIAALPTGARRVILLGPSHRQRFAGAALPRAEHAGFDTPLGPVAVDREAVRTLRAQRGFDGPPSAHDHEHCLEVQLPLLRARVPQAAIVPILIGGDTDRRQATAIARALAALLDPATVVVVSSDFTHHGAAYGYQPFPVDRALPDRLLAVGRATAARLAALDPDGFSQQVEVSKDTVCGVRPLEVLGELLRAAFEGNGELLEVTTSGEVLGDWRQSVTYAAVAFRGRWTPWREPPTAALLGELTPTEAEALTGLARAALRSHLVHDESLALWHAAHRKSGNLVAPAGAFVTLHRRGAAPGSPERLRACMGRLEAAQPLYEAVVSAAVSAARDPRFPPLEAAELDDLAVEVSALSAPTPVDSWRLVEPGVHGVILTVGGRSAVFLPQVATEQGWDLETMLDHLARKAGLARDAWQKPGARFEVFTARLAGEAE